MQSAACGQKTDSPKSGSSHLNVLGQIKIVPQLGIFNCLDERRPSSLKHLVREIDTKVQIVVSWISGSCDSASQLLTSQITHYVLHMFAFINKLLYRVSRVFSLWSAAARALAWRPGVETVIFPSFLGTNAATATRRVFITQHSARYHAQILSRSN